MYALVRARTGKSTRLIARLELTKRWRLLVRREGIILLRLLLKRKIRKNRIRIPMPTISKLVFVINGWKNPESNAKNTIR